LILYRTNGAGRLGGLSVDNWSGIGIFLPESQSQYEKYSRLPFYWKTRFWSRVPFAKLGE